MWRGQPEDFSIFTLSNNKIQLIVIDADCFASLSGESGFQSAIADELRSRLSINVLDISKLLKQAAMEFDDPLISSIDQLLLYLSGDSHTTLDKIINCPLNASLLEYISALRTQLKCVIKGGRLPQDLHQSLESILTSL
jgi:hypothetical protein